MELEAADAPEEALDNGKLLEANAAKATEVVFVEVTKVVLSWQA